MFWINGLFGSCFSHGPILAFLLLGLLVVPTWQLTIARYCIDWPIG
jgi:hypothetical protein